MQLFAHRLKLLGEGSTLYARQPHCLASVHSSHCQVQLVSQLFSGIVLRGGQSLGVVGSVDKFPDGSWQGSLAYAQEATTEVLNGTATLRTDTNETWIVDITDDATSLGGDCRSACFRILERRP